MHSLETASGPPRTSALHKARGAVGTALRQSKVAREGVPQALRVKGTHQWLSGYPLAAQRSWSRGAEAARALGARYDLARLDLEAGLRLANHDRLARAEAELSSMGVVADAARARAALTAL